MRFLFWSLYGDSLAMAMKCENEGNMVYFYIKDEKAKSMGEGLIERTKDWKSIIDKDTIIVFDMVKNGSTAEKLKKDGYKVIGAGNFNDNIELNRFFGTKLMQSIGIKTPTTRDFKNIDAGIEFVRETKGRYVFKPLGNKPTAFTYVSSGWRDMVEQLEHYKKNKELKMFQLQDFIDGIEISIEAWFDGNKFIKPINSTMEEKKFMAGDLGPNTGCMGNLVWFYKNNEPKLFQQTLKKMEPVLRGVKYCGPIDINTIISFEDKKPYGLEFTCFDEKTEVLTNNGWKLFKDLKISDLICTLNSKNHNIEYQRYKNYIERNYNGNMIGIKSNGKHTTLDALVTPNHQMYIKTYGKKNYEFCRADSLNGKGVYIPRTGRWNCSKQDYYIIPKYIENHCLNRYKKYIDIEHKELEIPFKLWAKFLGYYISEGNIHKCGTKTAYQVNVTQMNPKIVGKIKRLLNKLPFKYSYNGKTFRIDKVQLAEHLKSFGKCNEKYIPEYIKNAEPKIINAFLDAYCDGDGSRHRNQRIYFTTSRQLADDIQECILKIGAVGVVNKTNLKDTVMKVREKCYKRNYDIYTIRERKSKTNFLLFKNRHVRNIDYSGKVFCIEVPNHIIYVRRNGKPFFCGQSRFGYDAIWAQIELWNQDAGKVLYDIANKQLNKFDVDYKYASAVRVSIPPYPHTDNAREAEGVPIRGIEGYDNIHLADVKLDKDGDLVCSGADGVVCIITEKDMNPKLAYKKAYRVAKKLEIPDKQYRIDLHRRALEQLSILKKWGYYG